VERNNLPAPKVRYALSKQFEVLETKQRMHNVDTADLSDDSDYSEMFKYSEVSLLRHRGESLYELL